MGFPGSLAGKESSCNAGDSSSIPGSERSPGKGLGYPLQYSWASLVVQMVKNPPATQETWIQSLGLEDSPGGRHGNPLQYSCLENPHGQRSLVGDSTWGCRVGHDWVTKHSTAHLEDITGSVTHHSNEANITIKWVTPFVLVAQYINCVCTML